MHARHYRRPLLLNISLPVVLVALQLSIGFAQNAERSVILGRWDVTVEDPEGAYPSWFEVKLSGYRTYVGSFVGRFGSARPISEVEFDGKKLRFEIPPQWETRVSNIVFEGEWADGKVKGTTVDERGRKLTWTAVTAPDLKREGKPVWGEAIELFNGKDLSGWKSRDPEKEHGWIATDGILENAKPGMDIVTNQTFEDFKLHVEFRYPKGSNSGIYLRGRYEVQVEDNYGGEPESHRIGGVYGFLTPSINASRPADEWQSMDITLVGRVVTVVLNGERVIDRQAIPGPTGGALNSHEGEPGPLLIQGDHGPVEFRSIVLTPAVN